MLPASYQVPAAIILLTGGLLACFLGHRLFRIVLGFYGFVLGALIASSVMGVTDTAAMVIAAAVGGVVGAVILLAAYFVGVALVGAGLGALAANLIWTQIGGDPHPLVVILFAIAGAIAAAVLQRYVIIMGTAFGGAWTALAGALALVGDRIAQAAAARGDVWLAYPMHPAPGRRWLIAAWLVLGTVGAAVQLGFTARKRGK